MCFSHPMHLPKAAPTPQVAIPQTQPIQTQQPVTQTGADSANGPTSTVPGGGTAPRKKSLFQIDLTIPSNSSQVGAAGSSQTGASS